LSHVTYEGRPETCWKTVLCLVPVTILPHLRSRRTHTNTKTKQNKLRRRKPRGVSLLAQNGCGTKPTHHRAFGLCEGWGTTHQQAVMGSTETMSTTPTFFETGQKRARGETVCSTAAPSRRKSFNCFSSQRASGARFASDIKLAVLDQIGCRSLSFVACLGVRSRERLGAPSDRYIVAYVIHTTWYVNNGFV